MARGRWYARPMADVKPFRAVRYSGAAGPLADLVAPPYDAVGESERAELFTRSPYNVIHVTLPESAEEAAHLYHAWRADGILDEDDDSAAWLVVEDYVGPDGVGRERRGSRSLSPPSATRPEASSRTSARTRRSARSGFAYCARSACSPSRSSSSRMRDSSSIYRHESRTARSMRRACGGFRASTRRHSQGPSY